MRPCCLKPRGCLVRKTAGGTRARAACVCTKKNALPQPRPLSPSPIFPALAALIPLLRAALHLALLDPLARRLIPPRSPADVKKASKFAESAWKVASYLVLSGMAGAALRSSPWAPAPLGSAGSLAAARTAMWSTSWPSKVTLSPAAARYWRAQASFYLSALVSLFAWEHRRSDFRVMVAHHLTTIALITGATLAHLEAPGIAVAALHDPADIFLEGAKAASYAGCHTLATASFLALVGTWAGTRLMLLPLIAADAWRAGVGSGRGTGFLAAFAGGATPPIPAAKPLSVLLWALVLMHTYWFALIARIALSQLGSGRVTQDVREVSEEAEAVEKKKDGMEK